VEAHTSGSAWSWVGALLGVMYTSVSSTSLIAAREGTLANTSLLFDGACNIPGASTVVCWCLDLERLSSVGSKKKFNMGYFYN